MEPTEAENYYANIGFAGRVGFGHQPALLIIDWNYGCAHPVNPFDMGSKYGDVMAVEDVIAAFQRLPAAH